MKVINLIAKDSNLFLKDIFISNNYPPFIPTNIILFKNLTGIGATTMELNAERNSIIVEPNTPVIVGKSKKFINAFAVKYNVGHVDIIKYLMNESIKYKKIIVTPESFYKVKNAFKILEIDVYKEYFLLFDECEKISKEVNFRKSIIAPMDDFFKFENKAFVSATPIMPTDPRFEKQHFKILNIVPEYEVSIDITLYNTNNSLDTIIELLKKDKSDKKHFIFLNNVHAITTIIQRMKNHESSSIFCSENASVKLKQDKYSHIGSSIDETKFSKYNFFTSRFFSAVDIDIEEDINIYIVSDVNISLDTKLDPYTDVVQIIGRFRNKDYTKMTHVISTANENVPYMTKKEVEVFISTLKTVYETIVKILKTVTDIDSKKVLTQLEDILGFKKYILPDGRTNYFMIDNLYYDNNILSYYKSPYVLNDKYKECVLLNSNKHRFNILNTITESHGIGSDSQFVFGEIRTFLDIMDEVISNIRAIEMDANLDASNKKKQISHVKNRYRSAFPELIEAYNLVGLDRLLEECDSKKKVIELIKKVKGEQEGNNLGFIKELKEEFFIGKFDSGNQLLKQFSDLLEKHNLKSIKPTIPSLKKYVSISDRTKKNNLRGYFIRNHLV